MDYRVAKSQTQLKQLSTHAHNISLCVCVLVGGAGGASLFSQMVKNLSAVQTQV